MFTDHDSDFQPYLVLVTNKHDLSPHWVARVVAISSDQTFHLADGYRQTAGPFTLHWVNARPGDILSWGTAKDPVSDPDKNFAVAIGHTKTSSVLVPIPPRLVHTLAALQHEAPGSALGAPILKLKGVPIPCTPPKS